MTPRVLVIQHEAICPPGRLGKWLAEAGVLVEVVHPYVGEALPDHLDHDGLVVLGGTMSANDDDQHAWLGATKRLLRDAVSAAVPVLGVCLGHQLLAVACGGWVQVNPNGPTVGLRTVDLATGPNGDRDDPIFSGLPSGAVAIHWNDDAVTVAPPGAEILATTPDGWPQVMRLGQRAWGVQFHPEADPAIVAVWADRSVVAGDLTPDETRIHLTDIAAADDSVSATWQSWAHRFAALLSPPGAVPR